MTLTQIELIWEKKCDYCEELCCAGEIVWYNPTNKLVYHEHCGVFAEVGE